MTPADLAARYLLATPPGQTPARIVRPDGETVTMDLFIVECRAAEVSPYRVIQLCLQVTPRTEPSGP